MSLFTKNDSTSKLESELARLEKKRTALSGRLVSAQAAELAAIESRRRHLVESDDIDLSAGAKFSSAVDAAQRDVSAIRDALSELDQMVEEGKTAIVSAREASARQRRASEIEAKIAKLEPLSAQAERQFEALISTLEKIATEGDDPSLDVKEYRELQGHLDRLPVQSIIGASLAQAIFRDMPDLMTVEKSGAGLFARAYLPMMIARYEGLSRDLPIDHGDENSFTPKPLSGALTENVIAPLRTAAKEILDGSRPLAGNKPMIEDDRDIEPVFEHKLAVLTKPIKWRDHRGEWREHSDTSADLPWPVVDAAFAAGAAVAYTSPEAEAKLEQRYQLGFHSNSINMNKQTVTLDVKWPKTTRAAA
jgi:hypothetical protein